MNESDRNTRDAIRDAIDSRVDRIQQTLRDRGGAEAALARFKRAIKPARPGPASAPRHRAR